MNTVILLFITGATAKIFHSVDVRCPPKEKDLSASELLLPVLGNIYEDQDIKMLRETVKQFGSPRSLNDLPGPEIMTGKERDKMRNEFLKDEAGNYTIKIRKTMYDFSYNDRYELGEMIGHSLIVKGQFSEIFLRNGGGIYIRTLGYRRDENGYSLFLIDLSKVVTRKFRITYEEFTGSGRTEFCIPDISLPGALRGDPIQYRWRSCPECSSYQECDDQPAEPCKYGEITDICLRRVCSKGPGESCGTTTFLQRKFDLCSKGLSCSKNDTCMRE